MTNIIYYICVQLLLFIFQHFYSTRLEIFQYYEMLFGSIFIIIFFGIFGALLTLNKELLNEMILFATIFSIWYYITKKLVNNMNSDKNGVIYYN
jgi:hypothetical protein